MDITQLLEILCCPACHGDLEYRELPGRRGFLCCNCSLVYPIEDDMPIMLIDKAISLEKWEGRQ